MKINRKAIHASLTSTVCIFASIGCLDAATLAPNFLPGKPLEIMNTNEDADNTADISVVDGSAGYEGTGGNPNSNTSGEPAPVSGTFGDGTVVDYRFFGNVVDEDVSLELVTYASGSAGRISTVFATDAANVSGGNINFLDVWTITDPVNFTSTADHTTNTMARVADASGTIDISGMLSGDIYFLAGGFGGTERFTLTMTGAGQPDIVVVGQGSWPRPNRVHLHDWTFDNADLEYDTISYDFFHADRDGSAARFGGVILDGEFPIPVPEPSSLVLIGIGSLALLRRRR